MIEVEVRVLPFLTWECAGLFSLATVGVSRSKYEGYCLYTILCKHPNDCAGRELDNFGFGI